MITIRRYQLHIVVIWTGSCLLAVTLSFAICIRAVLPFYPTNMPNTDRSLSPSVTAATVLNIAKREAEQCIRNIPHGFDKVVRIKASRGGKLCHLSFNSLSNEIFSCVTPKQRARRKIQQSCGPNERESVLNSSPSTIFRVRRYDNKKKPYLIIQHNHTGLYMPRYVPVANANQTYEAPFTEDFNRIFYWWFDLVPGPKPRGRFRGYRLTNEEKTHALKRMYQERLAKWVEIPSGKLSMEQRVKGWSHFDWQLCEI